MSTTEAPTERIELPPEPNSGGVHAAAPRRRRRGWAITVVVIAVVAAGAAAVVVTDPFGKQTDQTTIDSGSKTGLAKVTKGSLSARSVESGTLGFAGDFKLINKAGGTYTALPKVGDVIKNGQVLYQVDNKPVVLLKGAFVPVFRELSWGTEGADVRQLNAALVALGYASSSKLDPASDEFGRQTYNALKKLQSAVGLDSTGVLSLGQAIFVPADQIRITVVSGQVGAAAGSGQGVLEGSSTSRQVTVALRASRQNNVKVGNEVIITLPGGKTTPGKVTAVGKVASKDSDGNVTVEVVITPTKAEETGDLDQAPVQVSIISETVQNVLAVPVNALLALAGGGYAVEVVNDAGVHRLIPVTTGLFDDNAGRVEVRGDGLAEGQNVVVPAS